MRFFKSVLLFILFAFLFFWALIVITHQNHSWQMANGNVDYEYWVIVPLIWLKVHGLGVFLIKSIVTTNREDFHEFKLITIYQRIVSNFLDFLCIGLIWLIIILFGALIILPLYKYGIIAPAYIQDHGYTDCINYLFDIGDYIYGAVFFIYYIALEYFQQSTFGKMMNNCGIISTQLNRPKLINIIIKNILRLIPINELWIYLKGYSLNEELSKTRIIFLEKHNQKKYNQLIK